MKSTPLGVKGIISISRLRAENEITQQHTVSTDLKPEFTLSVIAAPTLKSLLGAEISDVRLVSFSRKRDDMPISSDAIIIERYIIMPAFFEPSMKKPTELIAKAGPGLMQNINILLP